jgi:hypothetical protein
MNASLATIVTLALWFGCHLELAGAAEGQPAERLKRFDAIPGSNVTVEGHENIQAWKAEGTLITGFIEVAPGFPGASPETSKKGDIKARAEVFIPVRNLRAIGENWEPYNEQRTSTIHRRLRAEAHPKILFRLTGLVPTTASRATDAPYEFASTGELVIAGVTNPVSLPIKVMLVRGTTLKISGAVRVKQSDFKIIPKPTGFNCFGGDSDTVNVAFDWLVMEKGKG